jgi:hypothetical protein
MHPAPGQGGPFLQSTTPKFTITNYTPPFLKNHAKVASTSHKQNQKKIERLY